MVVPSVLEGHSPIDVPCHRRSGTTLSSRDLQLRLCRQSRQGCDLVRGHCVVRYRQRASGDDGRPRSGFRRSAWSPLARQISQTKLAATGSQIPLSRFATPLLLPPLDAEARSLLVPKWALGSGAFTACGSEQYSPLLCLSRRYRYILYFTLQPVPTPVAKPY